jgi:phosphotriesterase-related protein
MSRRHFLKLAWIAAVTAATAACRPAAAVRRGASAAASDKPKEATVKHLVTTLGLKRLEDLAGGIILPHEHVFVDLRTSDQPGYAEAAAADVAALMAPEVRRAWAAGVAAIVECSPVGVGRRADLDKAVSDATGFPIVVPTGIYREPWVPAWAREAAEDRLFHWMLGELRGDIGGSGVQAGWIKLSAGDDGLTPAEAKILRAAARAGQATGAVIGSHTIRGRVMRDTLDIVERAGYTAGRFIWIHTQAEPDFDLHLEMARRGCWLEYDNIGAPGTDEAHVRNILRVLEAGFGDRLLLSHDRGWYDPARPGGGTPMPYTYLPEAFLPRLRQAGVDEAAIRQLTVVNPFEAFAR